jgi:hypothetical protein
VEWILKLAAAGDEGRCVDIMEISKPDDLGDIANLRLTHMEAKQLLARVQRGVSRMWGDQAASGNCLTVLGVRSNRLPKPCPNAPL